MCELEGESIYDQCGQGSLAWISPLIATQGLGLQVPEDPRSWQRLMITKTNNIKINK
jgi:hypothetical protein